jgi:hypothetical protein
MAVFSINFEMAEVGCDLVWVGTLCYDNRFKILPYLCGEIFKLYIQ